MRKSAMITMTIIAFNLVLVWFSAMDFFGSQPQGVDVEYDEARYGFDKDPNWGIIIFLVTGVGILGAVISALTNINAFKMIMYMEIFWVPYFSSISIFDKILRDTPVAFWGIITIFTIIMFFVFANDLIEMSDASGAPG